MAICLVVHALEPRIKISGYIANTFKISTCGHCYKKKSNAEIQSIDCNYSTDHVIHL